MIGLIKLKLKQQSSLIAMSDVLNICPLIFFNVFNKCIIYTDKIKLHIIIIILSVFDIVTF